MVLGPHGTCFRNVDTGGPRIERILGSQGIVLLRNRTKRGLVLST